MRCASLLTGTAYQVSARIRHFRKGHPHWSPLLITFTPAPCGWVMHSTGSCFCRLQPTVSSLVNSSLDVDQKSIWCWWQVVCTPVLKLDWRLLSAGSPPSRSDYGIACFTVTVILMQFTQVIKQGSSGNSMCVSCPFHMCSSDEWLCHTSCGYACLHQTLDPTWSIEPVTKHSQIHNSAISMCSPPRRTTNLSSPKLLDHCHWICFIKVYKDWSTVCYNRSLAGT